MEIPWAAGPADEMAWQSLNGSLQLGERTVTFQSSDQWTSKRVVGKEGVTVTVPISLDRRRLSQGRWTMDFRVIDSLGQEGKWQSFGPVTVAVPPVIESYPQEVADQQFLIGGATGIIPGFETLDGKLIDGDELASTSVSLISMFHEADGSHTYLFESDQSKKLRLVARKSLFETVGLEPLVEDAELVALRKELIGKDVIGWGGGSGTVKKDAPPTSILGIMRAWRPRWVGNIWSLGPLRCQTGGFHDLWAADAADLRSRIRSK